VQRPFSLAEVDVLTLARAATVVERGGRRIEGEVQYDSYVSAVLTTVVWRGTDQRRSSAIAILPDMLPEEDFRKLRVLLRLGQPKTSHAATPARR
jgi:hypothetical protein